LYRHDLTADYVRELLDYNPDTGSLTWRATKSGRRSALAGTLGEWGNHGNKRRTITIDYVIYKAHRVIWLWMTGEWPKQQVDHVNRDAADNRWSNLRDVSQTKNQQNRRMNRNNTSGARGVYWYKNKKQKPWGVNISNKHYGYFRTKAEARRCARSIYELRKAAP
jgi:HNH endonuclease